MSKSNFSCLGSASQPKSKYFGRAVIVYTHTVPQSTSSGRREKGRSYAKRMHREPQKLDLSYLDSKNCLQMKDTEDDHVQP